MHFSRISFRLLVLCFSLVMLSGCFLQRKVSKAQRKTQKLEKTMQRAADVEYRKRVKAHYESQSPDTKKRMKKLGKISRKNMKPRYRPWYRDRLK